MLKTVSSITNAIGALNYKGTWNASTNTPSLASGAGTKGDYYVVSVAGSTALDGISNWGIGDWAVFNGSVWQRVEGGADLNGVNLSYTGTLTGGTGVINIGSGQIYKNAGGDVGVGVIPVAFSWPNGSANSFQLQSGAAVSSYNFTSYFSQNWYYNGGEKFIANGWAHRFSMGGGTVSILTSTVNNAGGAGAGLSWNTVGNWDSSGNFTILGATATKASGTAWANPSDERLKSNVHDYTKGLNELMQLRFVTGEYNGLGGTPKGAKFISVIAQEAKKVLPDTISTFFAKLNEDDEVETEFLKYDSSETQVLVAVSVQQLAKIIEEQQASIEQLKSEIQTLKGA